MLASTGESMVFSMSLVEEIVLSSRSRTTALPKPIRRPISPAATRLNGRFGLTACAL
jgi:hypothetical protein